jgi:hypothetical protein
MWLIYSTEVSLSFDIIPENTDAFVLFLHEFKNSVEAEIELLHSQPFTNSHCGIGDVPRVAAEAQTNGRPKGEGQGYKTVGL